MKLALSLLLKAELYLVHFVQIDLFKKGSTDFNTKVIELIEEIREFIRNEDK